MDKKIEKNFALSELNASDLVALNSLHEEDNTCHWESLC